MNLPTLDINFNNFQNLNSSVEGARKILDKYSIIWEVIQ